MALLLKDIWAYFEMTKEKTVDDPKFIYENLIARIGSLENENTSLWNEVKSMMKKTWDVIEAQIDQRKSIESLIATSESMIAKEKEVDNKLKLVDNTLNVLD